MSCAAPGGAQLVANADRYQISYGAELVVEAPGVVSNDTLHGSPAADDGVDVVLVDGVRHGQLSCPQDAGLELCSDGSFAYRPDLDFPGFDGFTYQATFGGESVLADVTVEACSGGPAIFLCWQENAYRAKLAELGYSSLWEGFEDDAAWWDARQPATAWSVRSRGMRWQSNHPEINGISTGTGPAVTGTYGVYDPAHGYATGSAAECDVDNPPEHCLFKDGFTGIREGGDQTLYGVGGYFMGVGQPDLELVLEGGAPIGLGLLSTGGQQFFGVIDTTGFTTFRIEEVEGKVGQARLVFGDDFIFGVFPPDTVPPQVTRIDSARGTADEEILEAEVTAVPITELIVSFSEAVRVFDQTVAGSVTNPLSYLLVDDNGDGFETESCGGGVAGNDIEIAVDWVRWEAGSSLTATVGINGGTPLGGGHYKLLVCAASSIADWAGNPLDGDGDGGGGDDFVRHFFINGGPAANADDAIVPRGGSVSVLAGGSSTVLENDSDPEADPLTATLVSGPLHGQLDFNPNGTFSYTHDGGVSAEDSFVYRVSDGWTQSSPAEVNIVILPFGVTPTPDPTLRERGIARAEAGGSNRPQASGTEGGPGHQSSAFDRPGR